MSRLGICGHTDPPLGDLPVSLVHQLGMNQSVSSGLLTTSLPNKVTAVAWSNDCVHSDGLKGKHSYRTQAPAVSWGGYQTASSRRRSTPKYT